MAEKHAQFAIVAEYRGVGLMERAGDKKAVWQGQEYFTDGRTYIGYDDGIGDGIESRAMFSFEFEQDAKLFIDTFRDNYDSLPEQYHKRLMTYTQLYEIIYKKPYRGKVPMYVWNEAEGVFTHVNGARDGQHRHGGLK